ncbi:hypothetical protein SAMN04488041_1034 [Sulfitobacter pontiacus]|jgi:hypothetical protein|uniref:Uncharacterized protein n=1 Tax=Sulfitobacter pontiacus TaxID=60137 RepID=A0A1H2VN13_9RHOB|nr:hypothetical protein SAMN04488041_1034 [Sulfitobacter pontiacus]
MAAGLDWTGREIDLKAFVNKRLMFSQNETLTFVKMFVFRYAL